MPALCPPRSSPLHHTLSVLGVCSTLLIGCSTTEHHDLKLNDAGDRADAAHDADLEDADSDASDSEPPGPETMRDSGIPPDQPVDDGGLEADAALPEVPWDEGAQPWERVPAEDVLAICKLDPEALRAADALLNTPWAVVRYGKLCHQFMGDGMKPRSAWSATKTLGALVTGMVAYETRDLARTGRKTGPLSDSDRVDHWLDSFTYNPDAQIAHVLAMIAHNASLVPNEREMVYDLAGVEQINSLSEVLNLAIKQDPTRLGADLDAFVQSFLFEKLGLANSTWIDGKAEKILGFGWATDIFDMAKVGQLMLQRGLWRGERVLDEEWVYRMTHPSFEDANTGYGYLTWVNSASNYSLGGTMFAQGLPEGPIMPGPCAPVSIYREHPHGLSSASDCNYDAPYSCDQEYDVGVWQAVGMLGQIIQGHPGLDLVVVGMDLTLDTNLDAPGKLWRALMPAVIGADPSFQGDEAAFCDAYGNNRYAPDLAP